MDEEKMVENLEEAMLSSEDNFPAKNGYPQVLPMRHGSIPDENCYWCLNGDAFNAKDCPLEKQKAFEVIVGAKFWIKTTAPLAIKCNLTRKFVFPYDYCDKFERKVSIGYESFVPACFKDKK